MDLLLNNTTLNKDLIKIIVRYDQFDLQILLCHVREHKKLCPRNLKITKEMIKKLILKCVNNGFSGYLQRLVRPQDYDKMKIIIEKHILETELKDILTYTFYDPVTTVIVKIKFPQHISGCVEVGLLDFVE